ncbi:FAD-dependent monooxygenase [Streptomyces sp. NPDC050704]|uniref:FAD-dependent monooxygenase n=1 Tax=Streptomyces sp. NPDC050704 TaxID=3157219 RepID=UPI00341ED598
MSNSDKDQVLIAGAGPGGLLLACELALAGVPCTVLERRTTPSVQSRATGLQARTLELLAMRGMAGDFMRAGHPHDHYRITVGRARIDLTQLDTEYQQLGICRQSVTEEIFERHARSHGARIERGVEVQAVSQTADGVTVRTSEGGTVRERRAGWLVGFDGSHSTVRTAAGIDFPGRSYPYNVMAGDVRLGRKPEDGMLVKVSKEGMVVAIDFGDGTWRMGAVDRRQPRDLDEPASLEELRDMITRVFGYDLHPYDPTYTARFRFHNRHATTYRKGRVLIGGDAAHVHPPLGAQGLNISCQDALNLGWKLAAVIRHGAPDSILDTYEQERRPIARRVLGATGRAMHMMMTPAPPLRLLRRLVVPTVTSLPVTHRFLAGQISNLSFAYPDGDRSGRGGLVGRRLPNTSVRHPGGEIRPLYDLFRSGRFVLLDQTGGAVPPVHQPWAKLVEAVEVELEGPPELAAHDLILSRPDGYCAWAGSREDAVGLGRALERWCGAPETPGVVALRT